MRTSPPGRHQLQHCIRTSHPPLRTPSRSLPHNHNSSPISPQAEKHLRPTNLHSKQPLQAHHQPNSRLLRLARRSLGQSLLLEQHTPTLHPSHKTLLPQRSPGRPAVPLPRQQPQHILVFLPCGGGFRLESWCQAWIVEGVEGRRVVGFRARVGAYGCYFGGQAVGCSGEGDPKGVCLVEGRWV